MYTSKCDYEGVSPIVTHLSALSGGVYLVTLKIAGIGQ